MTFARDVGALLDAAKLPAPGEVSVGGLDVLRAHEDDDEERS